MIESIAVSATPTFTDSDLRAAFNAARQWIMESRRGTSTWLVTRGHVLKPPFTVSGAEYEGALLLKVSGQGDEAVFLCNKAVTSRFRSGQIGFFLIGSNGAADPMKSRTLAGLNLAYQLILNAFPPNSRFTSEQLYANVQRSGGEEGENNPQAHARRRWKELKYDYGFDVDFVGGQYVRGPSAVPVIDPLPRPNDTMLRSVFWETLAVASCSATGDTLPRCNICGVRVVPRGVTLLDGEIPDDIGLLDHRRPVPQGGDDVAPNLQIACQTCNNRKARVCNACPFEFKCDTCFWAHPEDRRFRKLILALDAETADALEKYLGGSDLENLVKAHLESIAHSSE